MSNIKFQRNITITVLDEDQDQSYHVKSTDQSEVVVIEGLQGKHALNIEALLNAIKQVQDFKKG